MQMRIIVVLGVLFYCAAFTAKFACPVYAHEDGIINERIIELLKEKGILKEDEYEELKQLVEKDKEAKATTPKVTFKRGVTIETPDENFKLRLSGRFQGDFRAYESSNPGNSTFYIRRARLAMMGTFYKYYDFKVQADFGRKTSGRLMDGYINFRFLSQLQLQMGQYKQPFSLEEVRSDNWIDLVERSLANNFVPSRDVGIMLHGDLFKGGINYAIGISNGYRINETQDTDDHKDIIGRVVFSPFLKLDNSLLKGLHFGGSFTYGEQESAKDDWWRKGEFKTEAGTTFIEFNDDVFQDGTRKRLGGELCWIAGPLSLKGEWMNLKMDDLLLRNQKEDFRANAGYISLSYILTGEEQPFKNGVVKRITPRNNFDPYKKTWGAWQLLFRYSFLDADSDIFRSGFVNPLKYTDKAEAYALGVTWYLNDAVRMMFNYVRTEFDEDILYRSERIDNEDVFLGRFQLVW